MKPQVQLLAISQQPHLSSRFFSVTGDRTFSHLVGLTDPAVFLTYGVSRIPQLFTKVQILIRCFDQNGINRTQTTWQPSKLTVEKQSFQIFVCRPYPLPNQEDIWAASTPLRGRLILPVIFVQRAMTAKHSFGTSAPCPSVPWKIPFWRIMRREKSTTCNGRPPNPIGFRFVTMIKCKF